MSKESNENLPRSTEVKSSLLDRIAGAMYRHSVERLEIDGIKMWDQLPESVRACWHPAADAVIRELAMAKASRPNDYLFFKYPPGDRYITKWLTDE